MVSSPKPPDPYKQAGAQDQSNLFAATASAAINNPNEINPYGTSTNRIIGYDTITGADGKPHQVPRYERTTSLSPEQQRLYNLQTQMQANLGQLGVDQSAKLQGLLGTNVSTEGLTPWASYQQPGAIRQDTAPTDRAAIEQAMMSRYRENATKSNAAQDAQLAARGMSPGSSQYSSVNYDRMKADTDAVNQAYLASGQESRAAQEAYNAAEAMRYQLASDWANNQNTLRGGQLGERIQLRNQPLNEISALMSGSQVSVPQFQSFSRQGINPSPIGEYIGQNYAAKANAASATNQGLFGLGGSAISALPFMMPFMSDRRLKEDILPTGETLAGCPVYSFYFVGRPDLQVGVMADEVREVHPDLVFRDPTTGFDMVDYAGLIRRDR